VIVDGLTCATCSLTGVGKEGEGGRGGWSRREEGGHEEREESTFSLREEGRGGVEGGEGEQVAVLRLGWGGEDRRREL
jgi:hypothetical protein